MKTVIVIEVTHAKPIPHLASLVAGRAWTIGGVAGAEVKDTDARQKVRELRDAGFSFEEIALGMREFDQ